MLQITKETKTTAKMRNYAKIRNFFNENSYENQEQENLLLKQQTTN